MQQTENQAQTKNSEKDFKTKDAIIVFTSFALVCAAIIIVLMAYDVFTTHNFLSFKDPVVILIEVAAASSGVILFGIILTVFIPSTYIDDTNKSYQNNSLLSIVVFMFLAALFEELLFRGIIQNVLSVFIEQQWTAIIITTLLFLGFHTQYFKKPVMLLNISVPSLVFGWIYVETSNILAPFFVHFVMNIVMTLLFKYKLLSIKD
ncbi:CPBP family intramembrane metalloprotease [Priestia megaterium]|uniref:CPBP family intramembrane glutamic endopeptidase n=1 Tax=Priestia megaterium TaxID=1404 RepID=UPI002E1D460A|nr:CPBP family intramembrane metalloprotease [Priestia megaterium]